MEKMDVSIYNTASRSKEVFTPIESGKVRMYHCGPTVYWTQHIGNLRAVVMADIVRRTLEYVGYEVKLVRNYTDVGHLTSDEDAGEDKMATGARRDNLSPQEIADKYIGVYDNDVAALNVIEPAEKPKATEHINQIIAMVESLLEHEYAYTTKLGVYFDVSKAKDYTALSGASLHENIEGAGSGEVSDPDKRHHADFALWFFKAGTHERAIQTWHSPFSSPLVSDGEGFPGWHIECSAMSKEYLGDTLDIHMGGVEHISVHHTNEIAQSEAANQTKFVHYWLHNEHLLVNNSKMSKSDGTSYTLSDVVEKGIDPLALRFLFLGSHYRSKQNFTWESLEAAEVALHKIYKAVSKMPEGGSVLPDLKEEFTRSVTDDFNVTKALSTVFELLKSKNSDADKRATILDFDTVLGLQIEAKSLALRDTTQSIPENIQDLVQKRDLARSNKDWSLSDSIRDELESLGYQVNDTDNGTEVHKQS